MSKNSLSTLLGNYMSDSENDDNNDQEQQTTNSFSKDVDNLLNEIESTTTNIKETPPVTNWTKCMDPNTGHPYYWNITTKEVTWEKPQEYEKYLQEIKKFSNKLPDNCWIIGYSDGSTTPYYVNEYTREVSWVKPVNFKEKPIEEKTKKLKCTKNSSQAMKNLKKSKKVRKKSRLPDKLGTGSDEEVKIELISSYSRPQTESSSDDEKINKEKNVQNDIEKSAIKLKLVAAYATDDESDAELNDTNSITNKAIIPIKENSQQTIDSVIDSQKCSTPTNINNISSSSPNNSNLSPPLSPEKKPLKSFASIITGDKPENLFDDEINKLKEELEKDLINTIEQQQENDDDGGNKCTDNQNIENSFDEKTFQRKRRIEFKTNKKIILPVDNNIEKDNNEKENNKKKHLYSNFHRSHTEFINKNDDENSSGGVIEIIKNDINVGNTEEKDILKKNCEDLSDIISGKVKFLSVGHFEVSPVQAMNIQLETLLAAFRSSALDFDYFLKWLQQTSNDLLKLEENVAPNGWKCKWDRQTSQYCYLNVETDEIQWEFPKTNDISEEDSKTITKDNKTEAIKTNSDDKDDNNGEKEQLIDQINITTQLLMVDRNRGEDEMDISTTPPPNEHEQIILGQHWDADNAPPPPIISTPSPPPPPNYDSQSIFLSTELASFYSDIATLDPTLQNSNIDNNASDLISSSSSIVTSNKKRLNDTGTIESTTIQKKKRKKVKVQGLGMKDNEMSCMVAKWQKAQKELN